MLKPMRAPLLAVGALVLAGAAVSGAANIDCGVGGKAKIFEGSGGVFLIDSYRRGIAGTMPGMDLLDGIVAIWRALAAGDEETAYRVYFPVCALVSLQLQAGLDGFLAIEKYLMVKQGLFPSARRRKPHGWDLDPETAAEVDRLFDRLQASLR